MWPPGTLSLAAILVACGCDGRFRRRGGPIEYETISGRVIDGYVADALVCLDLSVNGSCDPQDIQVRSDATWVVTLCRVSEGFDGAADRPK